MTDDGRLGDRRFERGQDPAGDPLWASTNPNPPLEPTVAVPVVPPTVVQATLPPTAVMQPTPEYVVQAPVVQAPVLQPIAPAAEVIPLRDDRPRSPWLPVVAVVALLIGGLLGYLLGAAGEDDESANDVVQTSISATATTAAPATTAVGATAADVAAQLQGEVDRLNALQAQSAADLDQARRDATTAQQALATAETERNALRDQVAELGDTSEFQTQIDDLNEEVATARADVDAAQRDLATTQTQLDQANTDLATAKKDLATANTRLSQLNPVVLENLVSGDVSVARRLAATNGWFIIETPVDKVGAPGAVVGQAPAPGANMVSGSVLYVEVAKRPGP